VHTEIAAGADIWQLSRSMQPWPILLARHHQIGRQVLDLTGGRHLHLVPGPAIGDVDPGNSLLQNMPTGAGYCGKLRSAFRCIKFISL
jgi:hypothetical protein